MHESLSQPEHVFQENNYDFFTDPEKFDRYFEESWHEICWKPTANNSDIENKFTMTN